MFAIGLLSTWLVRVLTVLLNMFINISEWFTFDLREEWVRPLRLGEVPHPEVARLYPRKRVTRVFCGCGRCRQTADGTVQVTLTDMDGNSFQAYEMVNSLICGEQATEGQLVAGRRLRG